jgi:hypothetical protein
MLDELSILETIVGDAVDTVEVIVKPVLTQFERNELEYQQAGSQTDA